MSGRDISWFSFRLSVATNTFTKENPDYLSKDNTPMIQTYAHQKELHEAGLDIEILERLFANLIIHFLPISLSTFCQSHYPLFANLIIHW